MFHHVSTCFDIFGPTSQLSQAEPSSGGRDQAARGALPSRGERCLGGGLGRGGGAQSGHASFGGGGHGETVRSAMGVIELGHRYGQIWTDNDR